MIDQVRPFWSYVRVVNVFKYLVRFGFYPFSILPISTFLCDFTDVDLRIKICGKCFSMASRIGINDIQFMNLIEVMFSSICSENTCHSRVESTTKNCCKSLFLKSIMISPLPAVLKFCLFLRFIICCV